MGRDYEIVPGSGLPLLLFSVITTIYYVIKYNLDASNSMDTVYFLMYIMILVITHFFLNLNTTRALCGSNQWETTFYVTVGPWLIIFGFLYIGLKTFPSWLMPFSNTIGYGVALLAGLSETTEKLFKSTEKATSKDELGFLEKIYTDKSLIINEITINNFGNFWTKMSGLFSEEVKKDTTNVVQKELFNLVKMKELTAEYIWYIFAGFLITSISYNFIIGSSCKKSVQDMQQAHNTHELKSQEKYDATSEEEKRIYSITE